MSSFFAFGHRRLWLPIASLALLVVLLQAPRQSLAYPEGAPEGACASLTPKHGVGAQSGASRYGLYVSPNAVQSGGTVTVTVQGDSLRGLLIVARDANTGQSVGGSWQALDGSTKALPCGLTHTSNGDKQQASGAWTAPAGYRGQVVFAAAVVKSYDQFWNNVRSEAVSVQ